MNVISYSVKVWALAIGILWFCAGIYLIWDTQWDSNLVPQIPDLIGAALLVIAFSFILSAPSWLAFLFASYFIIPTQFDTITKKILLATLLVLIMAITVVISLGSIRYSLFDEFSLAIYAVSALAVAIVKLPQQQSPETPILP